MVGNRGQRWGRGYPKSKSRLRPGKAQKNVADKADLASDDTKRMVPSISDLLRDDEH